MSTKSQPQLSLIAQFDDLTRMVDDLFGDDEADSQVKQLLGNCEKQRCLWLLKHNELYEVKMSYEQAMKRVQGLEATLKHVREAFKKELALREKVQAERDDLFKKLNNIKESLIEECGNNDVTKESRSSLKELLAVIEQHKLTTVLEEEISTSDKSLSDIDYSKSDDNIIDDFTMNEPAAKEANGR